MSKTDIRWEQRLEFFSRALKKLGEGVALFEAEKAEGRELSELEKEGLIQRFEFTYEQAWLVMKDFSEQETPGQFQMLGTKSAMRAAFKIGLIEDEDTWLDTVKSRQLSSHTYDEATAEAIFQKIVGQYFAVFLAFDEKMTALLPDSKS